MTKKISIVLVDDSKSLCEYIADYFSKTEELEVIGVAHDGAEGYKMICEMKPDVALMDIVMPKMDGLELLERLHTTKMDKKITYIMLSAVGNDSITRKAIQLGAHYYIVKPFEKMDVLTKKSVRFTLQCTRKRRGNLVLFKWKGMRQFRRVRAEFPIRLMRKIYRLLLLM